MFPSVFICVYPWLKIIRIIPGLPLDVATHAGDLRFRRGPAFQHGLQRGAQVPACDRAAITGAAVIELPPVNQPAILAEKVKVRRAGGAIGFGDGLRFIVKIGNK